jgi:hypothetical protein
MACTTSTTTRVMPHGQLYIGDASAAGEILLSEVDSLSVNISAEFAEDYGGDGKVLTRVARVPSRITRGGSTVAKSITAANLARFFVGAESTQTTAATPVAGESINAGDALVGGAWYQLGVSATRPSGVRNVGSVTIDYGSGPTEADIDDDYVLDATLGRFQVVAGGALDGAEDVTADYTPVASTWERIATASDLYPAEVTLRFVADNLSGTNRDLYCPCVSMVPTGDLIWRSPQRDGVQELGFELAFLGEVYIDGRPVAV